MKNLDTILLEATDDMIREWEKSAGSSQWPSTMPVPIEALDVVWLKLHKRCIDLPLGK